PGQGGEGDGIGRPVEGRIGGHLVPVADQDPPGSEVGQALLVPFPVEGDQHIHPIALGEKEVVAYPDLVDGMASPNLCRKGANGVDLPPGPSRGLGEDLTAADDTLTRFAAEPEDEIDRLHATMPPVQPQLLWKNGGLS